MRNDYGSLVERWKVDLITARARKKGFRTDEIDDAEQEIVPAIMRFVYDPSKANGATETTALTALIDRQLTFIQRGCARRRKYERRYQQLHGAPACAPLEPDHQHRVGLTMDVRQAVADLPPLEQAVCAALARDEARFQIATEMCLTRYGLGRVIDGIRERFEAIGLDSWMRAI